MKLSFNTNAFSGVYTPGISEILELLAKIDLVDFRKE